MHHSEDHPRPLARRTNVQRNRMIRWAACLALLTLDIGCQTSPRPPAPEARATATPVAAPIPTPQPTATRIVSPPQTGDISANALRTALGTCAPVPGVTPFRTDENKAPSIAVCAATGAVWWTADFDVDCDGGTEPACRGDHTFLPDTAAHDSHGRPLDASHLPFVVVPLVSNGFDFRRAGLELGSVVAVLFGDKLEYAIIGDLGPRGVIGEGSFALAERLGINPDPNHGGTASGVTYIAFTGSDAVASPIENRARTEQIGTRRAALLETGGRP